jgi:hypothetical protein
MGTTSKGLPYPAATDSVDVPRDVKALADAVNPLVPQWKTYTPTWVSAGAPGSGPFVGRYTTVGPAGLLLAISWTLATGINLPSHVIIGLPPGLVLTTEPQGLAVRFYPNPGAGPNNYPGTALASGTQLALFSNDGAPLGAGQLVLGGNVSMQGVLTFTTPPT